MAQPTKRRRPVSPTIRRPVNKRLTRLNALSFAGRAVDDLDLLKFNYVQEQIDMLGELMRRFQR